MTRGFAYQARQGLSSQSGARFCVGVLALFPMGYHVANGSALVYTTLVVLLVLATLHPRLRGVKPPGGVTHSGPGLTYDTYASIMVTMRLRHTRKTDPCHTPSVATSMRIGTDYLDWMDAVVESGEAGIHSRTDIVCDALWLWRQEYKFNHQDRDDAGTD